MWPWLTIRQAFCKIHIVNIQIDGNPRIFFDYCTISRRKDGEFLGRRHRLEECEASKVESTKT